MRMAVDPAKHGKVSMAKQSGNVHRIHTGLPQLIIKGMPQIIKADFPTESLLRRKPLEATVHGIDRPWISFGVSKNRAFGILEHSTLSDLEGLVSEINKSDLFTAAVPFAFLGLKDPVLTLDVGLGDAQALLRSATRAPMNRQQIAEVLISNVGQKVVELRLSDCILASGLGRLFYVRRRISLHVFLLDGPIECPVESPPCPVFCSVRPVFVRVDPMLYVVSLERVCRNGSKPLVVEVVGECLAVFLVPLVRFFRPVLLRPIEEVVDDDRQCVSADRWGTLGHQLMELRLGIVLIGSKPVTFSVDGNVPLLSCFPEPEPVRACHDGLRLLSLKLRSSVIRLGKGLVSMNSITGGLKSQKSAKTQGLGP